MMSWPTSKELWRLSAELRSGSRGVRRSTTIVCRNWSLKMGNLVHTPVRRIVATLLAVGSAVAVVFLVADPVLAQVTTIETIPPAVDEDGLTAGERIDQIVFSIRLIATALLAITVAFWWHTHPGRRAVSTGVVAAGAEPAEEQPSIEEVVYGDPELEELLSLHLGVDVTADTGVVVETG